MPIDLQIDPDLEAPAALDLAVLHIVLQAVTVYVEDPRLQHDVCVRLCGEEESLNLNATYRGKDQSTNVLSFPADIDLPDAEVLGDLAICWPVVCTEAAAQGKSELHHFNHLFVHGLLHLLGFDHENPTEAQDMEALEVLVLGSLNISNPYDA